MADAARAVQRYERLGFRKEWDAPPKSLVHRYVRDIEAVSAEFRVPADEEGLAGRECDREDPDGNRLRIATRRS